MAEAEGGTGVGSVLDNLRQRGVPPTAQNGNMMRALMAQQQAQQVDPAQVAKEPDMIAVSENRSQRNDAPTPAYAGKASVAPKQPINAQTTATVAPQPLPTVAAANTQPGIAAGQVAPTDGVDMQSLIAAILGGAGLGGGAGYLAGRGGPPDVTGAPVLEMPAAAAPAAALPPTGRPDTATGDINPFAKDPGVEVSGVKGSKAPTVADAKNLSPRNVADAVEGNKLSFINWDKHISPDDGVSIPPVPKDVPSATSELAKVAAGSTATTPAANDVRELLKTPGAIEHIVQTNPKFFEALKAALMTGAKLAR